MPLRMAALLLALLLPMQAQLGKGPGTGGGAGNRTGPQTGARDVLTRPQTKAVPVALIIAGATGAVILVKKLVKKRRR